MGDFLGRLHGVQVAFETIRRVTCDIKKGVSWVTCDSKKRISWDTCDLSQAASSLVISRPNWCLLQNKILICANIPGHIISENGRGTFCET